MQTIVRTFCLGKSIKLIREEPFSRNPISISGGGDPRILCIRDTYSEVECGRVKEKRVEWRGVEASGVRESGVKGSGVEQRRVE